jgi:dihydroflavonol-4-reductase
MGDRVFVTGGTGFVGANLVRLLLDQGYEVRALARNHSNPANLKDLDLEIVMGDLNDPDLAILLEGCRYCFHAAAHYSLWQADQAQLHRSNVLGTRSLLAAARKAGVERTVYTSAVAAIGTHNPHQNHPHQNSPNSHPQAVDETFQAPPEKLIGAYKKSKYWAEQEAVQAVAQGHDVVIVNPSTPIGPWDVKPTPTGDMIVRFLQRRMPAYVDTGLNLIDVRDVAWGHLLALQRGKTGERYILGHQNMTLKQILDQLAQITGLQAPQRTVPLWLPLTVAWVEEKVLARFGYQPSVPLDGVRMSAHAMYYDAAKAVRELSLPQSPISTALTDAVQWFQAQ